MAFRDSIRLEQVYFNNLKSMISVLSSWANGETDAKMKDIIDTLIQADSAILLLYRNLGEEWNELTAMLQKEIHDLEDLKNTVEAYHDELNEKIDDNHNYLMALIRELQERVAALEVRMNAVEADLASLVRNYILDLEQENNVYSLTYNGTPVTFAMVQNWYAHPHMIWVRGLLDSEYTLLVPREYDTTTASGLFEWASLGFVNDSIHEVTVTLLPDNSVNLSTVVFDFGALANRVTAVETLITNYGGLPANASAETGAALVKGANSLNEWKKLQEGAFILDGVYNAQTYAYTFYHNGEVFNSAAEFKRIYDSGRLILIREIVSIRDRYGDPKNLTIYHYPSMCDITNTDANTYNYIINFFARYDVFAPYLLENFCDRIIEATCVHYVEIDEETQEEIVIDNFGASEPFEIFDYNIMIEFQDSAQNPDTVISGSIDNFNVYYSRDFTTLLRTEFDTHNVIITSRAEHGGNSSPYALDIKKGTMSIDGVTKSGYIIPITDFTFTNGVLNTRRLFCYDEGIADYTGA